MYQRINLKSNEIYLSGSLDLDGVKVITAEQMVPVGSPKIVLARDADLDGVVSRLFKEFKDGEKSANAFLPLFAGDKLDLLTHFVQFYQIIEKREG